MIDQSKLFYMWRAAMWARRARVGAEYNRGSYTIRAAWELSQARQILSMREYGAILNERHSMGWNVSTSTARAA